MARSGWNRKEVSTKKVFNNVRSTEITILIGIISGDKVVNPTTFIDYAENQQPPCNYPSLLRRIAFTFAAHCVLASINPLFADRQVRIWSRDIGILSRILIGRRTNNDFRLVLWLFLALSSQKYRVTRLTTDRCFQVQVAAAILGSRHFLSLPYLYWHSFTTGRLWFCFMFCLS